MEVNHDRFNINVFTSSYCIAEELVDVPVPAAAVTACGVPFHLHFLVPAIAHFPRATHFQKRTEGRVVG